MDPGILKLYGLFVLEENLDEFLKTPLSLFLKNSKQILEEVFDKLYKSTNKNTCYLLEGLNQTRAILSFHFFHNTFCYNLIQNLYYHIMLWERVRRIHNSLRENGFGEKSLEKLLSSFWRTEIQLIKKLSKPNFEHVFSWKTKIQLQIRG